MNFGELLGLDFVNTANNTQTNAAVITGLIGNGLVILFIIVVIAAIIYAALSGLKYIRAQGDDTKLGESNEAIKYVIIGVLVTFLGVIAVVIVSSTFSDGTQTQYAIRCVLGDFYLCQASPTSNNNSCGANQKSCRVPGETVCYPEDVDCPSI